MTKRAFGLSKSKIMSGRQCAKRLWLETHCREHAEVSHATQMTFDNGHMFGDIARSLIGEGPLIEHVDKIGLAISETKNQMRSNRTLFEPAFSHENVVSRADGLLRVHGGWHLIEVKAATSIRDYYLEDCAVQTWVAEGAGVHIKKVTLAFVNKRFVYQGKDNYRGLLNFEDITLPVSKHLPKVGQWVKALRKMLGGKEPDIQQGAHCSDPYACPFQGYCQSKAPAQAEQPVSILPYGRALAERMAEKGIDDLRDVPVADIKSVLHQRVQQAHISGRPSMVPGAGDALRKLGWPRYYVDFETIALPVPLWKGTRPYQQVPFQWSCHQETRGGTLYHSAFLDDTGEAPMEDFATSLIKALGKRGPVFVYNQAFEAARVKELANMLPTMEKPLLAIVDRMVDLLPITREHYYHPDMRGSFSIKAVLPTIAPDLTYDGLEHVQDGGMAQQVWLELVQGDLSSSRRAELRQGLLDYCERDTYGLVVLADFLQVN